MTSRGTYKTRTVVRLTGFSADLLRAWETRHGILAPQRTAGHHRLYTEEDLLVLRRVRSLMDEGQSIGEIASRGRVLLLEEALAETGTWLPKRSELPPPLALPALATEQQERLREFLVEAAQRMDGATLERGFGQVFALFPPDVVLGQILEPVAVELGERWESGRCNIAVEHFFSGFYIHQLRKLVEALRSGAEEAPLLLCACLPGEQHEIGLLTVAYHLARQGFRITYLGASVPFEDLERACELLQPRAVFLSVTTERTLAGDRRRLLALLRRRGRQFPIFVGGQGLGDSAAAIERAGGRAWPKGRPLNQLTPASLTS